MKSSTYYNLSKLSKAVQSSGQIEPIENRQLLIFVQRFSPILRGRLPVNRYRYRRILLIVRVRFLKHLKYALLKITPFYIYSLYLSIAMDRYSYRNSSNNNKSCPINYLLTYLLLSIDIGQYWTAWTVRKR